VAEPILCAVIVARNEDPYIARCIEAVLEVASSFQGCQVALVDSRSSDRTVDIARQYPITVVRVRDGIRCTAALSRLIGQGLTAGGAILFVDGDTTINPQWVQAAVSLLDEQPDVAGVGGKLREVYYRNGLPISENEDFFRMGSTIEDAYQLGGNAIYRRAALDAVGSFNPWVVSLSAHSSNRRHAPHGTAGCMGRVLAALPQRVDGRLWSGPAPLAQYAAVLGAREAAQPIRSLARLPRVRCRGSDLLRHNG
jgi:cellulose synthase/poly-beta-1,6-N-acetylglucosamine synthase-like glycosyltransferase